MIRSLFRKKKSSLLSEKFISFLKLQLGIRPVNEKWYLEAITHSSYKNINGNDTDNERLEFLGDAFISMVVADYLFDKYPEQQEGYLTQLRSKIVSRENLNKFGAAIGLEEHLLYQKGKNKYKSLVGNAFEALFGAVLLDKGYEFTKRCFIKHILNSHLDIPQILLNNRDYKSELLIYFQKNGGKIIFKTTNQSKGDLPFKAAILKNEEILGEGFGASKKAAEQAASKQVLNEL